MNFSNHKKLICLKILLYLIIFVLGWVAASKILINYKKISNLSKEQICDWFNQKNRSNYILDLADIKVNFKNFNIYIEIKEVFLRSDSANNHSKNLLNKKKNYPQIKIDNIQGKINILFMLLSGNIKINNFIAKNITFSANHLYVNQQLDKVEGEINIKFKHKIHSDMQLIANLIIDQINFTLNFQSNNLDDFSNGKFSLIHKNSNVRTLLKYLPENLMDPQLISWLNDALSFGAVKSSEIFIDTDNNFNLQMKFEDVLLKYAVGWPSLEHLSVNMKIINDNLEIYMYPTLPAASILNQPVKSLKAKLNLANSEPLLIEAQINSPILKGIEFLRKTNLLQDLGDNLAELSMQGNMDLMFNLLIPVEFNNPEEQFIKYLGECKLNQASLKIANIPIDNIFTNIKFANDYIATDKLIGKAFDIPIHTNFLLEKELLMINNSWFNLKTILAHNTQNNMLKSKEFWLLINKLYILDNLFENIKIINDANMFRLLFNNDNAKGTIIYNKKSSANQLIIDFEKLKIKSKQFKHTNYMGKILLSLIENINFNCNELYVDDIYLGAINFNVVEDNLKSLGSIINELKINEFNFLTNSINANFSGNIIKDVNNFNTTINGKINSVDFGSGLRELNINTKFIANGNGYINFDLNSSADPFTVDLSKITGKLKININSGFILGLDPGFGRVIGLLNIENIQRRLLLDFSDVTNRGFSFDNVIGDLDLNHGELNLNKVFIVGPSANIIISGRTSLLTEQLDLLIEVTSKAGTTLPLAAAVAAGNPIIGAAVWLFDYASGAKFSQFKFAKYKVTGTWNKPEINTLKNK